MIREHRATRTLTPHQPSLPSCRLLALVLFLPSENKKWVRAIFPFTRHVRVSQERYFSIALILTRSHNGWSFMAPILTQSRCALLVLGPSGFNVRVIQIWKKAIPAISIANCYTLLAKATLIYSQPNCFTWRELNHTIIQKLHLVYFGG